MSSQSKIHVAVVDDHPVVRFGLSAIINLQGDMAVVGEAGIRLEANNLVSHNATSLTRLYFNNNPLSTRTFNARGEPCGGFGYINPTSTPPSLPRNGQIVARFQF